MLKQKFAKTKKVFLQWIIPFTTGLLRSSRRLRRDSLAMTGRIDRPTSISVAMILLLAMVIGVGFFISQTRANPGDGSGTMEIIPANVMASSSDNQFDFTYTAAEAISSGELTLSIPASWTTPQYSSSSTAGYLSITASTGSPSVSINSITGAGPWLISITLSSMSAGSTFTLSYGADSSTKVTAPDLPVDQTEQAYTFTTKTKVTTALTEIASSPQITVMTYYSTEQGEGSFTATSNPPDAPTSLAQEGLDPDTGEAVTISLGGTTYDLSPTLGFSQSDPNTGDTVKFRIQIDDTSNFSSPVTDYTSTLSAQGSTSFTIGQLVGSGTYTTGSADQELAEGNYYWRVMSEDNTGATGSWAIANSGAIAFAVDSTPSAYWSDQGEGSFTATVPAPPTAPSLSSPANGATGVSLTPSLQLATTDPNEDHLKYKIELALNNTFTEGLQTFNQVSSQTGWSGKNADSNTTYTSGTTATYTLQSSLSLETLYYWRGYAIDPSGSNTWSSVSSTRSFTTVANYPPSTPSLSVPANSATNINPVTQFQFSATDTESDNLKYKIQIALNNTFTSGLQTFNQASSQTGWSGQNADSGTTYTSGSTATFTMQTALAYTTAYYWRVYAIDPAGSNTWSSASSIRNFTTGSEDFDYPGAVSGVSVIPEQGGARVKWTNPSDSDLDHINVYRGSSPAVLISSPAAVAGATQYFTDTGLTNGVPYYYILKPVDSLGNERPSTIQHPITPYEYLFDSVISTGSTANYGEIDNHGVRVSISSGTFSGTKQIRARNVINNNRPSGNLKRIGTVKDLSIVDDTAVEHVTTFSQALTLSFSYTDAEIESQGLREDALRISWWDETSSSWTQVGLSNQSVDTVNNIVSAQTTHFTQYGILGTPNLGALDDKITSPLAGLGTSLSAAEAAGQTTLSVADAAGFNVGDIIKITDATTANEVFTISQVNATDTDTLVVTSATTTDHASGKAVERVTTHKIHFTSSDSVTPIKYITFDFTPILADAEDNSFINNAGKTTTIVEGTHSGVTTGAVASFSTNGAFTWTATSAASLTGAIEMIFDYVKNPTARDQAYAVEIALKDSAGSVVSQGIALYNIKDGAMLSASVDPILSFTISGLTNGATVGSGTNKDTTNITATAVSIPFSTLDAGTAKIGAQKITIGTNADDGYTVTIEENESLKKTGSSTDIDDFSNNTGTPVVNSGPVYWASPISPYTGFFGYHTDDTDLSGGTANRFYGTYNKYAAFFTTGYAVAYNPGPVASSSEEITVVFKIEINDMQEAGDYTNVITYICTPVF